MNCLLTPALLCLIATTTLCNASLIPSFVRVGMCSDVHQQHDFDIVQFSGLWFVILQVPNEFVGITRCLTSNYTVVDPDGEFTSSRIGLADNGTQMSTAAELRMSNDGKHSFFITFEDLKHEIGISIAETDYENYACAYSCLQRFFFKAEIVIVLSRSPTIKKKYVERCKSTITERSGFSWSNLRAVEQGQASEKNFSSLSTAALEIIPLLTPPTVILDTLEAAWASLTCPYWEKHWAAVSQDLKSKTSLSDMVDKIDDGVDVLLKNLIEEKELMEEIFNEAPSSTSKITFTPCTIALGLLCVLFLHHPEVSKFEIA